MGRWCHTQINHAVSKGCLQGLAFCGLRHRGDGLAIGIAEPRKTALQHQFGVEQFQAQPLHAQLIPVLGEPGVEAE